MLDLELPADFPAEPYRAIHATVCSAAMVADVLEEFDAGWTGIAVRFLSLVASGDELTASLRDGGRYPDAPVLVRQERALLALTVNGNAALESFCYGLFAIGALIEPQRFPLATPTDRRNATMGATMRGFAESFAGEEITRALFWWLNSHEFGWWKEARSLLGQRISPHRMPAADHRPAYGLTHGEWSLRGVRVDAELATTKRAWIAEALRELVTATAGFTSRHVART